MKGREAPLLACLALAGCMVGPNYRTPAAPMSASFKEAAGWTPATPSDAADRKDWWTVFGDATLDDLEKKVEISNQNIIAAEAAYRQARALVSEQRAALFPTVSLTGSASKSGGGSNSAAGKAAAAGASTASYQVGAGASWAPDLWGAIRRGIENAKASAQATNAQLASARLSAQTELAADYIQLRQLDEEKRILDATVAADQRALDITRNKYRVGVAARSDVLTAQSLLESAKAGDVDLVQQRARTEHAIALLAGEAPAALTLAPSAWTLHLPAIPAGLPSTLLQRRPDVASAERLAAAANATIGIQVAAYYPSLSLTGQAGYASNELSQLFNASNSLWSVGASVAETVFDAGLRHAKVAAARAAYDQAVANYREAVLTALGQVEDNLAAQRVLEGEQVFTRKAADDAARNVTIALNEYKAGTVDYTTVATAQLTALTAANSELGVEAERLTTAVDLIAALGGGWTTAHL